MPTGILVSLGNGVLDTGDSTATTGSSFVIDVVLGTGTWDWIDEGGLFNIGSDSGTETGTYNLGTDGNVYFVPDDGTLPPDVDIATVATHPTYPAPDGTVQGTSGDDTMAEGYTDSETDSITAGNDVVVGGGGNDNIESGAGDDTVIGDQTGANDGEDTINAGAGDDTVYGDSIADASGVAETTEFSWEDQGIADGNSVAGGITGLTANGDIQVSMTITQDANFTSAEMSNDTLYNYNGLDDDSSIAFSGGDAGTDPNTGVVTLDFAAAASGYSDEVSDVTFGIFDLDLQPGQFSDQVIIKAYDADGNEVPVTLTTIGGGTTAIVTDDATGTATATVENGWLSIVNPDDDDGFVQVNVAGPVASITIDYNNVDTDYGDQSIRIGDVELTTIPDASAPEGGAADVIYGDAGADTIFGQGGDDLLDGGADQDYIDGGTGADTIYGDQAPNTELPTEFSWEDQGIADGSSVTGGVTGLTANGDIQVAMTITQDANFTSAEMSDNTLYDYNGQDDDSSIVIEGGAAGTDQNAAVITLDFTAAEAGYVDEVSNVTFGIFDLDLMPDQFFDQVIITAVDADGNEVPVTLTTIAGGTTAIVTDNATGTATATVENNPGANLSTDSVETFLQVNVAGPVASITIDYNNVNTAYGGHAIHIGDIELTAIPEAEVGAADVIVGGAGDDTIFGQGGDDTITGGADNDSVTGGLGSDTIILGEGFGNDLIDGSEDAGDTDVDVLDASALTGDTTLDLSGADPENGTLTDGANVATFDNIEVVELGSGDDSVIGSTGDDSVVAGAGADTINMGAGNDTVDLGAGSPDGDADVVVLQDGFGADVLNNFDAPTPNGDGTFTGIDMLDVTSLLDAGGDPVNTADTTVSDDGNGNAVLTFPNGESITLTGIAPTDADNPFYLHAMGIPLQDGTIEGTAGNDVIDGSYTGDPDGDLIDNDDAVLPGDTGDDDLIYGYGGDDSITAGAGNDEVFGGTGNDTIAGNTGDDTIAGEAGDDVILLNDNYGNDLIDGDETSETSGDTIDGSGLTQNVTVNFSAPEAGTISNGTDTATFSNIEHVITGAGDDTVTGGAVSEDITTGGGNDTILSTGTGADTIDTGAGDDTITFSEGDSIDGGEGNDVFTLEDLGEPTNGAINITGGTGGETLGGGDTLQLGDLADISTLATTSDGTNADGNETFSGSITLDDGTLLTFSEIENIICFTPGTRIATPQGARDVADLRPGDMVLTRDHGLQPIRWIQSRTVPAMDKFAPIRIRPGVATGQERDLLVSPQHQMLFEGYRAELLFGESEVLVAAKHLVDGNLVTQDEGGEVTYIHMMFDQHELIYAEGAITESFHPGDVSLTAITDPAREELFALFPELRSNLGGYGSTARRCLRKHEAILL